MPKIVHYNSKHIGTIIIITTAQSVTIRTKRLEFRSLNQSKLASLIEEYTALLGDAKNVTMFREGRVWDRTRVATLLEHEIARWQEGDKFSYFSVHDINTQDFIGSLNINHALASYAKLGHSNGVEIGYIIDAKFWGKGYGTEIATVGKKYIKHLITIIDKKLTQPPKEIVATVHPQNVSSKKILQKTLKKHESEEFFKYKEQPRLLFFKDLSTFKGLTPQYSEVSKSPELVPDASEDLKKALLSPDNEFEDIDLGDAPETMQHESPASTCCIIF